MSARATCVALLFAVALPACAEEKERDETESAPAKAKKKSKKSKKRKGKDGDDGATMKASSAPAPPPKPPSAVDLEKMTWTEGGEIRPLVRTDLAKRCFVKDAEVVLIEGASITPLMGQRGCVVRPWGEKGAWIGILTDEIPVKMRALDDMEGVGKVLERTDESWLAEAQEDAGTTFHGRLHRKMGKRTFYCFVSGADKDLPAARGLLELCTTLRSPIVKPASPPP